MIELAKIANEAFKETLWPTRCAICDTQGNLLCKQCMLKLPFIDLATACPVCGEPFGAYQCCGCTPVGKNLPEHLRNSYKKPFDKCISTFLLNKETGRLITAYKDQGERRLAGVMAYFITSYLSPEIVKSCTFMTYMPSTEAAFRRRGFDHSLLLAKEASRLICLPLLSLFEKPESSDQRELGRKDRGTNMAGRFRLVQEHRGRCFSGSILLVDDVFTTGATLESASTTLKKVGFEHVFCATFARTY